MKKIIAFVLLCLLVAACNTATKSPPSPAPNHPDNQPATNVGDILEMRVQLSPDGTQASAEIHSLAGVSTTSFDNTRVNLPLAVPAVTTLKHGNKRYFNIVLQVTNNTSAPIKQLHYVMMKVPTSKGNTPFTVVRNVNRQDITPFPTSLTFASLKEYSPAQGTVVDSAKSDYTTISDLTGLPTQPAGTSYENYGFLVHNAAHDSTTIAPNEKGFVSFSFEYTTESVAKDPFIVNFAFQGYSQQVVATPTTPQGAKIAAGYKHALALKDGKVYAWGDNAKGQTNVPSDLAPPSPVTSEGVRTVPTPSANQAVAVAAGNAHSVALKSDGTVVAWGDNTYGQSTVPTGLSDVVAISAGHNYTLALKKDGTVAAWGRNSFGLTNVSSLSGISAISAGEYHALALKSDGTVVAWGDTENGKTTIPTGLADVTMISAGGEHSMALKKDGTVVAWGSNTSQQSTVPSAITAPDALSAGYSQSLALKNNDVTAWGSNDKGQRDIPALFATLQTKFADIDATALYSMLLTNDGKVIIIGTKDAAIKQMAQATPSAIKYDGKIATSLQEYASVESSQAIPDNDSAGVSSTIAIADNILRIDELQIKFEHSYVGDLVFSVSNPTGSFDIISRVCDNRDSILAAPLTLRDDSSTSISTCDTAGSNAWTEHPNYKTPVTLASLGSGTGDWTLKIADGSPGDTGNLLQWKIKALISNTVIPADAYSHYFSYSTSSTPTPEAH